MKIPFAVILILLVNIVYSQDQEIENLIKIKNELELKEKILKDSLKNIELKINKLKSIESFKKLEFDEKRYTTAKPIMKGIIKDAPEANGNKIGAFDENDNIKIFIYNNGYWLIEKDLKKGYIHNMYFENDNYMDTLVTIYNKKHMKELFEKNNQEALKREQEQLEQQREQARILIEKQFEEEQKDSLRKINIIAKYGQKIGQKLIDKTIWIGMTEEMLYDSWGQPKEINRTVTKYGEHKQCIYSSAYVYVENGVVTSWQDKE